VVAAPDADPTIALAIVQPDVRDADDIDAETVGMEPDI